MPKLKRAPVEMLAPRWRIYRVIGCRSIEVGSYCYRQDAERTLRFLQRVTPQFLYYLDAIDG